MIILTPRQKKLIKTFLERGWIGLADFQLFYTTVPSRKEAIERFIISGIIKDLGNHKFEINKEKVMEVLNE